MSVATHSAGLRRYADVLGAPSVPPVVCAGLIGRLPIGMAPLATLLLLRGEGRSYAVAGFVVACASLASAITGPALGRLVDRIGQTRVLLPLALGYPAALGALTLLATRGAPTAALAACAALAGVMQPPVGACMRALWPSLLESEELRATAYALEAWLQELIFIVGPLIVALIASFAPAWAAMLAAAVCGGAGTGAFAVCAVVRAVGGSPRTHSRAGALASAALRTIILSSLAMGSAFGVVEVTMPAFAEAHGTRSQGGFALACFALGSLFGGLWIGTRPPTHRLDRRLALSLGLLALALVPPLVAPSLPVMCVLMLIAGLPIAPAAAACYGLVGALAVPNTTTEAFAWLGTAIVTGIALGTSVGGVAVESVGITRALALAAPCAGVAAIVATARRASLALREPVA